MLKGYVKECICFQTKDNVLIVLGVTQWIAILLFGYSFFL